MHKVDNVRWERIVLLAGNGKDVRLKLVVPVRHVRRHPHDCVVVSLNDLGVLVSPLEVSLDVSLEKSQCHAISLWNPNLFWAVDP